MIHFLALSAACLIPAVSASAATPAPELSAAYSQAQEALPRVSLRDVDACFERPADARADALGLPLRFCIKRVGTLEPASAVTPFDNDGSGIVEGTPVAGTLKHISGGVRRADGGWDINVDLFGAPARKAVCGRLNTAFAAIYFSVDAVGRPIPGPVTVRGFMMDGAPLCRDRAASVDLDYRPSP
jgi:hypothetical protein